MYIIDRPAGFSSLLLCILVTACASGEALTPQQQAQYDALEQKYQDAQEERAQLHQRLEDQFRSNSQIERSSKKVVKGVLACAVDGGAAKISLKTFKKKPTVLKFKRKGGANQGCNRLTAQVKK